jgi:hypothetical protein
MKRKKGYGNNRFSYKSKDLSDRDSTPQTYIEKKRSESEMEEYDGERENYAPALEM